jgi:pyruvate formate lyase activating enzyme
MDQETQIDERIATADVAVDEARPLESGISRRRLLQYGAAGLACATCAGGLGLYFTNRGAAATTAEVFPNDAPTDKLWQLWQDRGWAREAQHYLKLGKNVQCKLCPNECLLGPEDRSRCRVRVNKGGTLYTLAYGNPAMAHVDPVEKKPLFHFLPGTSAFSIATAGCGFRCLNCKNWTISQRKPEEVKDPRGEFLRIQPRHLLAATEQEINRMTMLPQDVVEMADYFNCRSIAYTYSEPTVWFEYMHDTAKAARARNIKNIWVTCGYIQREPLERLCQYLDGVHVDLKGFDEKTYAELNSGKLAPVLATLKTLKKEGVWFEVVNLIVPGYTDDMQTIRKMCRWLLTNLGPDYPLHFSRFKPEHKLTHLSPTAADVLLEARRVAREEGLNYVYIGNCHEMADAETTLCPNCSKPIVERTGFSVRTMKAAGGKCGFCQTAIPGVWA